jgi:hypothetical protein
MADTIQLYNHTAKLFANKEVTIGTNLKVMLLDSDASFTATHTVIGDVSGDQVSGNGWDSGGEPLQSAAVTTVTTNDAKLDAADLVITASGGPIGPASYAVIYDDAHASDVLLAFITFDSPQTATAGNDFSIVWNASGIFTWTVT